LGTWLWRNPRLWHRGLRRSRSIHPSRSHTPKHTYHSITPWRQPHHHISRRQPCPNARLRHRSFPWHNQFLNTHSQCVFNAQISPYPQARCKQTVPKQTDTHSQCVFFNKKIKCKQK
jgi:hypothetical protein